MLSSIGAGVEGNHGGPHGSVFVRGTENRVQKETSFASKIYGYAGAAKCSARPVAAAALQTNGNPTEYIFFGGNRSARLDASADVYYTSATTWAAHERQ